MAKGYYAGSATLASGLHAADNELEFIIATTTMAQKSATVPKRGGASLPFLWTTAAYRPNDADWPSGTYTVALDCSACGANITYGARTVGASSGHFARVNAALSSELDTKQDAQAAFSGTGVKSASSGTWDSASGTNTDRFEVLIAATNSSTSANQTITLDLNESDDSVAGAWRDSWTGDPAAESVEVTDAVATSKASTYTRTASDSVSVSDSVTTRLWKKISCSASDSVTATDTAARAASIHRRVNTVESRYYVTW